MSPEVEEIGADADGAMPKQCLPQRRQLPFQWCFGRLVGFGGVGRFVGSWQGLASVCRWL